ncbi:MAG: Gfo/Idh/MocA family protein [bacterium]
MAKKINVGMVGYKFMGKAHSHAYRDVDMFFETETVPVMKVICGRTETAVAEAARKFGWEAYETSWERLVQREDIGLVDINTPNSTHREIAVAAAKAGKHILCEKPLAVSLAEAEEMLEAVEEAGVKHMVCFNYRKVPAVGLAKKLIDEGGLGKIYHFRAQYLQDWITDPEFPLVWRLKKEEAGAGAHGDINSHIIDLARYLVGDFAKVVGMQETFIKKRPELEVSEKLTTGLTAESRRPELGKVTVDDATLFLARFKNGALGSFEATRFANGRRNGLRFEINGSKGSLLFELENMNELWFYSCEDPDGMQGFRRIQATEATHPYIEAWWPPGHIIGYEHTFVHVVYDFMKALDEDRMPTPNFADGVECQRVLEAVEKSVKEERWVEVG